MLPGRGSLAARLANASRHGPLQRIEEAWATVHWRTKSNTSGVLGDWFLGGRVDGPTRMSVARGYDRVRDKHVVDCAPFRVPSAVNVVASSIHYAVATVGNTIGGRSRIESGEGLLGMAYFLHLQNLDGLSRIGMPAGVLDAALDDVVNATTDLFTASLGASGGDAPVSSP